jgi:hypothetical protein
MPPEKGKNVTETKGVVSVRAKRTGAIFQIYEFGWKK